MLRGAPKKFAVSMIIPSCTDLPPVRAVPARFGWVRKAAARTDGYGWLMRLWPFVVAVWAGVAAGSATSGRMVDAAIYGIAALVGLAILIAGSAWNAMRLTLLAFQCRDRTVADQDAAIARHASLMIATLKVALNAFALTITGSIGARAHHCDGYRRCRRGAVLLTILPRLGSTSLSLARG